MAKANTGYNNSTLKQQNRGLILKLIATNECHTRVELAERTGLSKMAATNVINEFLSDGIVEEKAPIEKAGKGRNPMQIVISDKAPKIIGVHISRIECNVVLCDIQLNVINTIGFKINKKNSGQILQLMYQCIDEMLEEAKGERIYGIGVGTIGPVDDINGIILNPVDFYGYKDIEIVRLIKERYELPVAFDSQYNCAAMAEKYFGNGKDSDDFLFVGLSKGIGSGLFSGGEPYKNRSGFTSEIGHVSIDWNGNRCSCGNRGCLETYASSNIIADKLKEATGQDLSFREFCALYNSRAPKAVDEIFIEMMDKLSSGIVDVVNMFNPQKVIIGHEGYWIPDRFIKVLDEKINTKKLSGSYRTVLVEKSYFEDTSHVRGCTCSVLSRLFDGEAF